MIMIPTTTTTTTSSSTAAAAAAAAAAATTTTISFGPQIGDAGLLRWLEAGGAARPYLGGPMEGTWIVDGEFPGEVRATTVECDC